MMNRKIAKTAIALSLAAAPLAAHASTADKAMNACAAALTAEMSRTMDAAPAYRLDDSHSGGGRLNEVSIFYLDARDAETREVVARADCVVDSRARVKRIMTLPLDAADAGERAFSSN